jgi:DNA-binding response OmpR family regulator
MCGSVLVIDLDIGSCLLMKKAITSLGYYCDIAHSEDDGLRAAASTNYNLIIVGCLLGDKSCSVLIRAIKLLPRSGPCPSVIGVLSCPDSAMEMRCIDMGMERVLTKPVSKAALEDCFDEVQIQNSHISIREQNTETQGEDDCLVAATICTRYPGSPSTLGVLNNMPPVNQDMDAGHLNLGELNRTCTAS